MLDAITTAGGPPAAPAKDVYAQVMAKLNQLSDVTAANVAAAMGLSGLAADDQIMVSSVDADGKPTDADLLSGCTIAVERYRDAVVRACENAKAVGSARGHRAVLGVSERNDTKELTADDDHDVTAQVDITVAALTLDADSRVTGAVADVAEPALTVGADGTVSAPELVKTKVELGDSYGMRGASSLDKEWYEHSEGWCDYLKGKTRTEIAGIPDDGSDADLAALCTISVTELQKAALAAFAEE